MALRENRDINQKMLWFLKKKRAISEPKNGRFTARFFRLFEDANGVRAYLTGESEVLDAG